MKKPVTSVPPAAATRVLPCLWFAAVTAAGFSLGVSVHLCTDLMSRKSVHFLFVSTLVKGTSLDDRCWIGLNMVLGFFLIGAAYRRFHKGG
ncbi:MAG TPA: hypothetical protein ENN69_01955 [Spirochaetia bacterium]|nr:hypothetical protein [Spirochaetia bacterium]